MSTELGAAGEQTIGSVVLPTPDFWKWKRARSRSKGRYARPGKKKRFDGSIGWSLPMTP